MTTLQTAKINDTGIQLAFLDSGAPSDGTYTTLVIIHGHTYHAQSFSRLLPIAHKHNLRVIALNRRDYVGSTLFSADELNVINSHDDDAHRAFLQARGLEIAQFLFWVITEKKIPQASADGKEGGLALLGWSLGNLTSTAFLRHLKSYPSEVVETISPYMRTFYIYECGSGTLGYPSPEGGYHPLGDTSIPSRMRGIYFGNWVSSYYKHPYYSRTSRPDRNICELQVRAPESDQVYRTSTLDTITASDLVRCVDPAPPARSEQPFMSTINRAIMYDQTLGVFRLDYMPPSTQLPGSPNDQNAESNALLPDVKICIIYGDASVWSCTWCIWELEKDHEKWKQERRKLRPIQFLPVEGANHFLHWDDPELFLKVVEDGLRS